MKDVSGGAPLHLASQWIPPQQNCRSAGELVLRHPPLLLMSWTMDRPLRQPDSTGRSRQWMSTYLRDCHCGHLLILPICWSDQTSIPIAGVEGRSHDPSCFCSRPIWLPRSLLLVLRVWCICLSSCGCMLQSPNWCWACRSFRGVWDDLESKSPYVECF